MDLSAVIRTDYDAIVEDESVMGGGEEEEDDVEPPET